MRSLNEIGLKHGTDKASSGHGYLDFYQRFLPAPGAAVILWEAGAGGYEYPDRGGQSARMWGEYYVNGTIITVDKYPKNFNLFPHPNGVFAEFSQDNATAWNDLAKTGEPDIIIDDASHQMQLSIAMFEAAFPHLKPGGVYIWEDVHTSLWAGEYGGNPKPMVPGTSLHFLARLMYGLQVDTIQEQFREKWDGHIESMHFMRNTCVIIKRK